MGPGALVYRSSPSEVRRWRLLHVGIGLPLALVGVLSVWAGMAGGLSGDGAAGGGGGGTTMVLVLYVAVGFVILAFGLRYALLGLRGHGIVLYERAVEADFPGRWFIVPERRLEGLVRVRVEGTPQATSAYAIAASGHAVALPTSFVEHSDLWMLGALGTRPVAPGGRAAARIAKSAGGEAGEADVLVELDGQAPAAPVTAPAAAPAGAAPTRWRSGEAAVPAARPRSVPAPPPPLPPLPPPPPTPSLAATSPAPPVPRAPVPPSSPTVPAASAEEGLLVELEPIEAPPPAPSVDSGFELEQIEPPPSPPEPRPAPPRAKGSDWEEVDVPLG